MKPNAVQLERIRTSLGIQFPGIRLEKIIKTLEVTISRKTGRVRAILSGDTLLFSLRTSDGRYLPTFEGGQWLLAQGYTGNQVVMNADAAPFVAAGKSAFCKHVITVDRALIPGAETLLMDEDGQLLAVGTAQHPGYIIEILDTGMAARVKHSKD